MKHLFLTAFMAIFGVYALGLVGLVEMGPRQNDVSATQTASQQQALSFTERVAVNDHAQKNSYKAGHKEGYTLKAMR